MNKNIKIEDITFIIVTYRSNQIIENCLKFLPVESPKIIVENSNDENFKTFLEKNYVNLKCYLTGKNLGYGAANNFGICKSLTKYIFILNPDVQIDKGGFDKMIEILNSEHFDLAAPINIDDQMNYDFKNKNTKDVDYVKGFAMIMKKDYFMKFLFDENIFLYLEEIDLCKRIKKEIGKIIVLKNFVKHFGGDSHGNKGDLEMEKSRNWHWMWSKFYYHRKHSGYIFSFLITFPNFMNFLLKYIFFKILKNKKNQTKYKMRFLGLYNSYLLKKSFYRPYEND